MTTFDNPTDSPAGWVAEHTRRYLESDGSAELAHIWRKGAPTLLVTTIGRRSGTPRRTALIYGRDGDKYLVVASNGGADRAPQWYRNLDANPEVLVQVEGKRFVARARTATPSEKPLLWKLMAEIWPDYDRYQTKTERDIQVVILEPTGDAA